VRPHTTILYNHHNDYLIDYRLCRHSLSMAAATEADSLCFRPFRRVALVGGTHGNESTGVFVLRRLQSHPEVLSRSDMEVRMDGFSPLGRPHSRRRLTTSSPTPRRWRPSAGLWTRT
jgi:hypothetical protein